MTESDVLDRLAQLAGIEPHYHDTWGHHRDLSFDTKYALLGAMGFGLTTENDRAASLAALEAAPWRRVIEEVVIVRTEGAVQVGTTINHQAADAGRYIAWMLTEEGGRVHQGTARLKELPLSERRIVEGDAIERRSLRLPPNLPTGYHRLQLAIEGAASLSEGATLLVVAPTRCYLPGALEGGPGIWGFAAQLYALVGRQSWGMGDFGDLRRFVDESAMLGADVVGLNPTNALFIDNPTHISPYSPSSRSFLNVLYIDVPAVPDFADSAPARERYAMPDFQKALALLREGRLVDYVGVSALKLPMLELLYHAFSANQLDRQTPRALAFQRFREEQGHALEVFAAHEALAEWFRAGRTGHVSWRQWPVGYRDPTSPLVVEFIRKQRQRLSFFEYLQWEADRQMSAASATATGRGMALGLYRDLALGSDPDGADAWAQQRYMAFEANMGAPPDRFNPMGQNWGLPPFNPITLRRDHYRPFINVLRSNMRHAGGLRIDHILGFLRLYWIPQGVSPKEGGYIRYPLAELLAITALESHRARCVVVGEDLGTVPEGLRARMAESRVLSCRVLYFERDRDGSFLPPAHYPLLSQIAVSTHDLPTLLGYWRERDIDLYAKLGLFATQDGALVARQERAEMRIALLSALRTMGLWPEDEGSSSSAEASGRLAEAVYSYIARAPGRLLMVQPEDVLGMEEQANLPGTVDEHPNWRQKLSVPHEAFAVDPRATTLGRLLRTLRPSPVGHGAGGQRR